MEKLGPVESPAAKSWKALRMEVEWLPQWFRRAFRSKYQTERLYLFELTAAVSSHLHLPGSVQFDWRKRQAPNYTQVQGLAGGTQARMSQHGGAILNRLSPPNRPLCCSPDRPADR